MPPHGCKGDMDMEAMRAAELLIDKIKRDYSDDISFVLLMGSYLYRETHEKSDVDLFYCAKTKRGEQLAEVFIIDGVGFDFWCIPWERLERIANHEERITAVLTEGKLLYYGSEDDLARFQRLRDQALDTRDHDKFRRRAREELGRTYPAYFALQNAETLSQARYRAFGVLFPLTYSIALLNRATVKRGRGKLKGEILAMPLVPKDFSALYDVVFESQNRQEIQTAMARLIRNTERLLEAEHRLTDDTPVPLRQRAQGLYEEMINFYNKIEHGCAVGDLQTALFAAVELTDEWADAFGGSEVAIDELPDIVGAFDPQRPDRFLAAVREHQVKLLRILREHDVPIREYADFEALRRHLDTL